MRLTNALADTIASEIISAIESDPHLSWTTGSYVALEGDDAKVCAVGAASVLELHHHYPGTDVARINLFYSNSERTGQRWLARRLGLKDDDTSAQHSITQGMVEGNDGTLYADMEPDRPAYYRFGYRIGAAVRHHFTKGGEAS